MLIALCMICVLQMCMCVSVVSLSVCNTTCIWSAVIITVYDSNSSSVLTRFCSDSWRWAWFPMFKCLSRHSLSYPAFQPKWREGAQRPSVRGWAHHPQNPPQPQVPALPALQRQQRLQWVSGERQRREQRESAEGQFRDPRLHGVALIPGLWQHVRQSESKHVYYGNQEE